MVIDIQRSSLPSMHSLIMSWWKIIDQYKHLGTFLDNKWSFEANVDAVCHCLSY
uniref:Uncharacterized protein n=1 Tax=Anguilla anguilla TaxID=7936 RepID=A0A0E9UPF0_ANGAN